MKVFVNDKVYIQNNDLAYLMRGAEGLAIPGSIFYKFFGRVFIVTDSNRYEFVEFSLPEEIVNACCQINEERNRIAIEFNGMPEKEREY